MALKLALYKGTKPGIPGIYNRLVRWWTRSQYSHVEIVFSDGWCGSSSFQDGGVRLKQIDFKSENWDFVALPADLEAFARDWFRHHAGLKYDVLGNLQFILPFIPSSRNRWFCSEAAGAALDLSMPEYYHPGLLTSVAAALNRRG